MSIDVKPSVGVKEIIPMQFFGIGDIMFTITLARKYWLPYAKVTWPVLPHYVSGLNRAYPPINFIDYSEINVDWDNKTSRVTDDGKWIVPLRWSYDITHQPFCDCMKSKYNMFGLDWRQWKDDAMWLRDGLKELELFHKLVPAGASYVLVNKNFRCDFSGKAKFDFKIDPNGVHIVEMREIEGYSIFDWRMIIENATEIHTVSTSIIYMLELLKIPAHIYIRRPDERSHANYYYLMEQNHIFQP